MLDTVAAAALGAVQRRVGGVQQIICYLTPADEATPGGRTNRMQRMRP
jgi:hypothetical protein